jgi:hypothetical protein
LGTNVGFASEDSQFGKLPVNVIRLEFPPGRDRNRQALVANTRRGSVQCFLHLLSRTPTLGEDFAASQKKITCGNYSLFD